MILGSKLWKYLRLYEVGWDFYISKTYRSIVDDHGFELDLGKFFLCHFPADFEEQSIAELLDVGFVNGSDLGSVVNRSIVEGKSGNSFDTGTSYDLEINYLNNFYF